jgi:hypothetical protein
LALFAGALSQESRKAPISGTVALCRKTPLLAKIDLTGNHLTAVFNIDPEAAETAVATGDHSSGS